MSRLKAAGGVSKSINKLKSDDKQSTESSEDDAAAVTNASETYNSSNADTMQSATPQLGEIDLLKGQTSGQNTDWSTIMPAVGDTSHDQRRDQTALEGAPTSSTTQFAQETIEQLNNITLDGSSAEVASALPPVPHPIFTTYELVENLVYFMTTYDLTVATRVCVTWRDIIERSKNLRAHIAKLQAPGWKALRPGEKRRGESPKDKTWHLVQKIPKGKLLLTRVQGCEMALFVPSKIRQPVICLDGRYEKRVKMIRCGERRLVWYDKAGVQVCNTIGTDEEYNLFSIGTGMYAEYMNTFYGTGKSAKIETSVSEGSRGFGRVLSWRDWHSRHTGAHSGRRTPIWQRLHLVHGPRP